MVGVDGYVKPIQLQLVHSVEEYALPESNEHDKDYEESIHLQQQKTRKENRVLRKEGVDRNETALRRSARERKVGQLEDVRYGKLMY